MTSRVLLYSFFLGGIIVSLAAFLIHELELHIEFARVTVTSPRAIYYAALFNVANVVLWTIIVSLLRHRNLPSEKRPNPIQLLLAVTFKMLVILVVVYTLAHASRDFLSSFLVGFLASLLVSILLLVIFMSVRFERSESK